MNDSCFEKLCDKIGMDAIGKQNRFIRELKKQLRKSIVVITEQEQNIFRELETIIGKLETQNIVFESQNGSISNNEGSI